MRIAGADGQIKSLGPLPLKGSCPSCNCQIYEVLTSLLRATAQTFKKKKNKKKTLCFREKKKALWKYSGAADWRFFPHKGCLVGLKKPHNKLVPSLTADFYQLVPNFLTA